MGYYSEPPWERPAREAFAALERLESRIARDRRHATLPAASSAASPACTPASTAGAGPVASGPASVPPVAEMVDRAGEEAA